ASTAIEHATIHARHTDRRVSRLRVSNSTARRLSHGRSALSLSRVRLLRGGSFAGERTGAVGWGAMLRRLSLCLVLGGAACEVEVEGVPAGKLAVVGDVVLGPEDLAGVQSQLGPYAKLRFRGVEGEFALLEGLVVTELLAQEA